MVVSSVEKIRATCRWVSDTTEELVYFQGVPFLALLTKSGSFAQKSKMRPTMMFSCTLPHSHHTHNTYHCHHCNADGKRR